MAEGSRSVDLIDSSSSCGNLRHRLHNSHSAVIHNGSFMNEAFPTKLQESYEDIDISNDNCIQYEVFPAQPDPTQDSIHHVVELFPACDDVTIETDNNNQCFTLTSESNNAVATVGGEAVLVASIQSAVSSSDLDGDIHIPDHQHFQNEQVVGSDIPSSFSSSFHDNTKLVFCSPTSVSVPNSEANMQINSTDESNIWSGHEYADSTSARDDVKSSISENDSLVKHGESVSEVMVTPLGNSTATTYDSQVATSNCSEFQISSTEELGVPVNESVTTVHYFDNSKHPVSVEGVDGVCDTVALSDSSQLTSLAAFLSVSSATDSSAGDDVSEAALQLIKTISPNGTIELVDGRVYCIQQPTCDVVPVDSSQPLSNIEPSETITVVQDDQDISKPTTDKEPSSSRTSFQNNPAKYPKKSKANQEKRKGGWPKGKKRKLDGFRIKSPKTAYILYAKKRRKEIMLEHKNFTFSEVTVIMGREWTRLDPKVKEEYRKLAEEDQKRFTQELKEYQQTDAYQEILKRKRDETTAKLGVVEDEDLGYVEEEFTLYCHICDQRFSSRHNRKEHLAGKVHLNNLQAELHKQKQPVQEKESNKSADNCCNHCVNKLADVSVDTSFDINNHVETILYKHSQRELELQMLRENVKKLKEVHSQLSKSVISLQETEFKLKQEIAANKQWQLQLNNSIDNLKMVPTLFGVINF